MGLQILYERAKTSQHEIVSPHAQNERGVPEWRRLHTVRAVLRTILAMSIVAETVVAPFCLKPTCGEYFVHARCPWKAAGVRGRTTLERSLLDVLCAFGPSLASCPNHRRLGLTPLAARFSRQLRGDVLHGVGRV